jgi:hypothetical protein
MFLIPFAFLHKCTHESLLSLIEFLQCMMHIGDRLPTFFSPSHDLEFYVCFMSDDELKKLYIYLFILFYFYKKIAFFYAMNNNAIEHLFIYLLLISQYVWFTRSNVFFCDNFFHHGNPKKIVM